MSGRYYEYDKGSSRSTRDDSRPRERYRNHERRSRSRSRSPRRWSPPRSSYSPDRERSSLSKEHDRRREYDDKNKRYKDEESEEVPPPPPPPRISKISIDFSKPKAPIKMSLSAPTKPAAKPTVASVFNNDDDDDEPEEMPAEAKMRMRNIGRETPTSAGPNSFGKTKQGFCDAKKVFEKNLKQALESTEKPPMPKLPQTIYKIKGP